MCLDHLLDRLSLCCANEADGDLEEVDVVLRSQPGIIFTFILLPFLLFITKVTKLNQLTEDVPAFVYCLCIFMYGVRIEICNRMKRHTGLE